MSRFDYKEWMRRTAEGYGFKTGDINYLFCDDDTVLDYNIRFHGTIITPI